VEKRDNDQDTKITQLAQKSKKQTNKTKQFTDETNSTTPGKRPKFYGRVAPTVGK